MIESKIKTSKWKKHEIEENIGHDKFKNNQSWMGNFNFVIGANIRLDSAWSCIEQNAKDWKLHLNKAIYAVDKINNLTPRPQFVVICGNLVNEMPNNDNEIYQLQVNDFMKIFSNLHPSISLVCVCGNHDVGNIPDEKSINQYRHNFGHDYFSFWCGGVLFLVLNSQYYTSCNNVKELSVEQDKWLTEKLNTHKGQRIIIFQHVPWFVDNIDENNVYFNMDKSFRQEMLEKMNSAGVSHVFCGHYHSNCYRYYKNLEIVSTNAIGATADEDPSGLRIVKVYENNVIHTYYPLDQMPGTIVE